MTSHILRLLATGLVAVLLLSSCSSGGDTPSSTPASPGVPSPSPTPTATPTPSPSTVQERAAVEGIVMYLEVLDRLASDPQADLDELHNVAREQALAQMQSTLLQYRQDGWRKVGTQVSTFVSGTPGSSAAEWSITMCVDSTGVDIVDSAGNSVVEPGSQRRFLSEFDVQQMGESGIWFVTRDEVVGTC